MSKLDIIRDWYSYKESGKSIDHILNRPCNNDFFFEFVALLLYDYNI